jgi:uncharacterized membrane protein
MTSRASHQLERVLATTLSWGTWAASSAVALGLALALWHSRAATGKMALQRDTRITTAGIALFVLLPVIRVTVMLFAFLRARDYRFCVIAALVLVITLFGLLAGMRL